MAIGSEARSTFLAIVKGDASQAVSEFKKLGSSVEKSTKGAEGSVGKFKQATSGAFAEIKANAGLMAAGAGVAIAGFAVKAVNDFAKLGIEVGKFADATSLSTEEASRWIEVAGDYGVEAGSLQTALGKFAKSIDVDTFRQFGIEIATTDQGLTDVNATFLNAIDTIRGMKDPTEKATAATKLFGRGWQDLAEIIGTGSKGLKSRLDDVADVKVFSPQEVAKSREYRDAIDGLTDSLGEMAQKAAKDLLPTVTALVKGLERIIDLADDLDLTNLDPLGTRNSTGSGWKELQTQVKAAGDEFFKTKWAIDNNIRSMDDLQRVWFGFEPPVAQINASVKAATESFRKNEQAQRDLVNVRIDQHFKYMEDGAEQASDATERLAKAEKAAYDRTRNLRQALVDLNNIQLDALGAKLDAVDAYNELIIAQRDYDAAVKEGSASTEELALQANALARQAAELDRAQQEAAGGTQDAAEQNKVLLDYYNKLQSTLKVGSPLWLAIEAYKQQLLSIPSNVNTKVTVNGKVVQDNTSGKQGAGAGFGIVGTAAAGTDRARRGTYLVGENGPELVSMRGGERVYPTPDTMAMLGAAKLGQSSGNTTNVYVTVNGGDPDAVVRKIKEYQRRGGVI